MSTAHGRLRSRWSRERRCCRAVHVQQTTSRPRQAQRGSQLRYVVAEDRRSVHENNRDRHQPLLVEILHCPVGRRNVPVDEVDLVLPKELLRALAEQSTRSGVDDNAWCHGSILAPGRSGATAASPRGGSRELACPATVQRVNLRRLLVAVLATAPLGAYSSDGQRRTSSPFFDRG